MFFSENLKRRRSIQHCFFSNKNGFSKGIYESLNCGVGSKDDKENVQKNLFTVSKQFKIDKKNLLLMHQTHSNIVKVIERKNVQERLYCDSMLSKDASIALGVLTADCAPILIFEKQKGIVGCIHAGWRGALNQIIENTLEELNKIGGKNENLVVCVGPCISEKSYEVKNDFYLNFIKHSENNKLFFKKKTNEAFCFDLRGFINKKFKDLGVTEIDNILIDTFLEKNEYFSHRRAKKLGENDYGRCISIIKKNI